MTDIMMTPPPPQPAQQAPGAPARQRKRRYVQAVQQQEEAAPDQVVQRRRGATVRVSGGDEARMQRYTPEERWERISSGRWKFARAMVSGNNYVRLTASESEIRGDNNHIYGNRNVITGDNNVVHGNNNVVHGFGTRFEGVENVELPPAAPPEAQRGQGDPFEFQDSDNEAEGPDMIEHLAILDFIANTAQNIETLAQRREPAPAEPPPAPRQTDQRVHNELMPKAGQPPDQNNWKVSLLDITGESKTPARQDLECCLCLTAERDVLYEPCGHMTSCRECTRLLYDQGSKCPQCRTPIQYARIIFY